jgi:hypothetical protein
VNKLHRQEAESGMRRLLKNKWIWALALVSLALAGSWLILGQSRITPANCNRIYTGMTLRQVCEILGEPERQIESVEGLRGRCKDSLSLYWDDYECGRYILVEFITAPGDEHGLDPDRTLALRSQFLQDHPLPVRELLNRRWEALRWYAKEAAEKIGVKWD